MGFAYQGSNVPIVPKGNAGIPKYVAGHIPSDGTPELMADYAVMARACGAKIIGGCCGTMPTNLRAMREALDTRTMAEAPSLDEIVAKLGAFSSATDGTGDNEPGPRRTRRSRQKAN